jgi:two-component system CheB/CheR fusion protein
MTMALHTVLRRWGWDVIVAHDGLAAISAIRSARPTVALIDIGLPKLDGLEVARRIRADGSAPVSRLVALSGFGGTLDRDRSRQAGFDLHLVKPVEPDLLRAALA